MYFQYPVKTCLELVTMRPFIYAKDVHYQTVISVSQGRTACIGRGRWVEEKDRHGRHSDLIVYKRTMAIQCPKDKGHVYQVTV